MLGIGLDIHRFTIIQSTSSNTSYATETRAILSPGAALYYAWHARSGWGVQIALGYEYNAILSSGFSAEERKLYNYVSPGIYLSKDNGNTTWRLGFSYNIGLQGNFSGYDVRYVGGSYIFAWDKKLHNNNHAFGLFLKYSYHNLVETFDILNYENKHYIITLGLDYRFNMGF